MSMQSIKLIKLHLICSFCMLLSLLYLSCSYLDIHSCLNSLYINCISNSFLNYDYNTIFSFLNINSLSLISKNAVIIIVSNDAFEKFKLLKNLKENLNK